MTYFCGSGNALAADAGDLFESATRAPVLGTLLRDIPAVTEAAGTARPERADAVRPTTGLATCR